MAHATRQKAAERASKEQQEIAARMAALRTAPSMESVDSAATYEATTRFDVKSYSQTNIPRRECVNEYSDSECDGQQDWASVIKEVDLTASEDISCDDDNEEDHVQQSQTSVCSNFSSGSFYKATDISSLKQRENIELQASYQDAPTQMTNSPTKTGHFIPRPVPAYCLVAKTAEQYGFSPLVISVGTSYFQRLAAVDPPLRKAALSCPDFAPFVRDIPESPRRLRKSVGAPLHQCQTAGHWLMAVHLTCIYVAAKNVEVVPYVHLLQTMLQCLHGLIVTQDQAETLELEVLVALDWRLGPFFLHSREQ